MKLLYKVADGCGSGILRVWVAEEFDGTARVELPGVHQIHVRNVRNGFEGEMRVRFEGGEIIRPLSDCRSLDPPVLEGLAATRDVPVGPPILTDFLRLRLPASAADTRAGGQAEEFSGEDGR